MNFLNLGLGELMGLIGVVSAGVVALYLLDRSKHKHIVSTLRFWNPAGSRTELKHRRRIQQPWSLLLQIISLILLLLAIAGPQFGVFDGPGRAHVIVLDTSAWMGSLTAQGTLLDQAKANARAYLAALPRRDRVMILRADAVATPATAFETDRGLINTAIQESQAGASALDLTRAFDFATRAQSLQPSAPGEIVYIGAGRVNAEEATLTRYPSNLRAIISRVPSGNVGLRKVSLRRSRTTPGMWDIFVAAHNYDTKPRTVALELQFAKAPAGAQTLTIAPEADAQATFSYLTKAGGDLEARLNVRDAFPQDNRVIVEVPPQTLGHAIVYTNDASLKPLFEADPALDTEFRTPDTYDAGAKADLIVIDGFKPSVPPRTNAIWIAPPPDGSPIPVRGTATKAAIARWHEDTPLGAGLYTQDVVLPTTELFAPAAGDVIVASAASGPIIVARNDAAAGGATKQVILGFRPTQGPMKYELATPLLIANILRWMSPGASRAEIDADIVGLTSVNLPANTTPSSVHVLDQSNAALPFTIEPAADGDKLQFFSGAPGNVRIQLRDRELLYSLTLPDLADATWNPPAAAAKGIPRRSFAESAVTDIWPWLAIAGTLGLLADWILFGRNRALNFAVRRAA